MAGATESEARTAEPTPKRRLYRGIAHNESLPPAILGTIGVVFAAFVIYNFIIEQTTLTVDLPPLIALLQGVLPTFGLFYAAYWLQDSDFDAVKRWQVTGGGVGGLILFGGTTLVTLFVRWAEGRVVGEARYAVFATAGAGTVAGLLVGLLYARSRRETEQVKNTRDQFELLNSIIRHDVLNRVMIIRSRGKYIRDNTDDQLSEFADTIVTQSDEISEQVERTRALLEALSGRRASTEPTNLRPAVKSNIETLWSTHDALDVTIDVPDVTVEADEMIVDVIGNILSNAVEYSDQETIEIAVTANVRDDHVDLRVADNGPGVADEMKDAIFRRDKTGLHEDGTGSGFGLFFVDTMMTNYGGEVWVEDNEPRGAIFVLRFNRPGGEGGD